MKHFLIYTNRHKDRDLATTRRICDYLQLKGRRATVMAGESSGETERSGHVPGDADCMIVLGGDGTVLQAARLTKRLRIPIIGVNLGTLGYLTEVEVLNLEESLERLVAGEYEQESRMMLNGKVTFADGGEAEDWALNDIVISRSGPLQIIRFNIFVNGQFLNDYSADGVIVTTPTGSTGYNLSAGGPLVEPGARLIMLTPICPHSLNQRSIILSPEDVIEIEIPKRSEGGIQTVEANFDGSHVIPLRAGDRLRIVRSRETTEFLRLNQVSFLEVLHKKMQES
ncbi:MAG: NAD(+)/NADH kinase [Lachnospiraceae bacterium]|nr:NAD(+)/NADH kinase [uncultured Acetatifactor sp.]MCI9219581.1 NAD(+)/NADH kinase [Lachnospiraceae bacterium]